MILLGHKIIKLRNKYILKLCNFLNSLNLPNEFLVIVDFFPSRLYFTLKMNEDKLIRMYDNIIDRLLMNSLNE